MTRKKKSTSKFSDLFRPCLPSPSLMNSASYVTHQYTTNLMKPKPLFRIGHPEISSVTIDPTGQLLGAMMSKWYPTIWSLDDPHPLAVLKSEPTVDGDAQTQGGFRDVCTIKVSELCLAGVHSTSLKQAINQHTSYSFSPRSNRLAWWILQSCPFRFHLLCGGER
jgi:hypothetical protein